MKIKIWSNHHAPDLLPEVAAAWRGDQLLILCPPQLGDRSFVSRLQSVREWPEPPVLGVFTSGTLGQPRLVLYSRQNIEASLNAIHELFDLSRIEHLFCYPQAFHTFGLTLGYVASLLRGWTLHTPLGKYSRASHAARVALSAEKVLTLGTPTHFYDLIQYVRETGERIVPSYSCIMGGAVVSPQLWMEVRQELAIEAPSIGYGCTEASPGISHLAPGILPESEGEIGRPLRSVQSSISTRGVCIQGASLCLAILQNGKIDFPKRLWVRDQIRPGVDGSWQFLGRLDLTLNRGGMKFSLEAIERDLAARLRVPVVASAVRDMRLGEDLALTIAGPETVAGELDGALAHWGLQSRRERVRFVKEFPLNECSKLDRRRVKEAFDMREISL